MHILILASWLVGTAAFAVEPPCDRLLGSHLKRAFGDARVTSTEWAAQQHLAPAFVRRLRARLPDIAWALAAQGSVRVRPESRAPWSTPGELRLGDGTAASLFRKARPRDLFVSANLMLERDRFQTFGPFAAAVLEVAAEYGIGAHALVWVPNYAGEFKKLRGRWFVRTDDVLTPVRLNERRGGVVVPRPRRVPLGDYPEAFVLLEWTADSLVAPD